MQAVSKRYETTKGGLEVREEQDTDIQSQVSERSTELWNFEAKQEVIAIAYGLAHGNNPIWMHVLLWRLQHHTMLFPPPLVELLMICEVTAATIMR